MKNYNQIISFIFTVIFITVFSIFNFSEYKEFHQEKKELENKKIELEEKINNFKLNNIKELSDVEIYKTPDKELLNKIVSLIKNAKKEVFIEVYMLTEKRIQEAIKVAHKKGINIQIILEKDPYKAYSINNKAYNNLIKAGIDIIWSEKKHYSYNHTKILLIDGLSIISTGNLSYSTFTKNRDFFIFTKDKNIYSKLKQNFDFDFKKKNISIYDENLIISPTYSRKKIEKLIIGANESIDMYFQYMKDEKLVNQLINLKKEKNIDINIIIAKTASDDEEILRLKKEGIGINIMSKYKMHSKAILIDKKYLFLGSINMSEYSIDKNREIGILIKNNNIINQFLNIYKQDIKNSN